MRTLLLTMLLCTTALAQEASTPVLTAAQKAQLTETTYRIEITQLRLQNAQLALRLAEDAMEHEKKIAEEVIGKMMINGYRIDLQKQEYVRIESPKLEEGVK